MAKKKKSFTEQYEEAKEKRAEERESAAESSDTSFTAQYEQAQQERERANYDAALQEDIEQKRKRNYAQAQYNKAVRENRLLNNAYSNIQTPQDIEDDAINGTFSYSDYINQKAAQKTIDKYSSDDSVIKNQSKLGTGDYVALSNYRMNKIGNGLTDDEKKTVEDIGKKYNTLKQNGVNRSDIDIAGLPSGVSLQQAGMYASGKSVHDATRAELTDDEAEKILGDPDIKAAVDDYNSVTKGPEKTYYREQLAQKVDLSTSDIDRLAEYAANGSMEMTQTQAHDKAVSNIREASRDENVSHLLDEYKKWYSMSINSPEQDAEGNYTDPEYDSLNDKMKTVHSQLKEMTGKSDDEVSELLYNERQLANEQYTQQQANTISKMQNTGSVAKNIGGFALSNALSIGMSLGSGYSALQGNLTKNQPAGYPTDTNSPYYVTTNYQEQNQEISGNNVESIAGAPGKFIYNAGYSALQSAANQMVSLGAVSVTGITGTAAQIALNVGTLTPMALNSYASAYKDALDRGLTEDKAQQIAGINGVVEAATELIGLENLADISGLTGKAARSFWKNLLLQSGLEGSEEGIGDIADEIADRVLNADQSEYETKVKQYILNGMTEDEAKQQATQEFYIQCLQDTLSGALSGGMMTGVATATRKAQNSRAAQSMFDESYTEQDYRAMSEGLTADSDDGQYYVDKIKEESTAIADKMAAGEEVSKKDKASLYDAIDSLAQTDQAGAQSVNDVLESKKVREYLDDKYRSQAETVPEEYRSEKENYSYNDMYSDMSEAARTHDASAFGAAYQRGINSASKEASKMADTVADKFISQMTKEGMYENEIVSAMNTTKQNLYLSGYNGTAEDRYSSMTAEQKEAYMSGKMAKLNKKGAAIENSSDITSTAETEEGSVKLTGKFTQEYVKGKGNQILLETEDGSSVSASSITGYVSEAVKSLYNNASSQASADIANSYVENYEALQKSKNDLSVSAYNDLFNRVYAYGATGTISFDEAVKKLGSIAEALNNNSALKSIYDIGAQEQVKTKGTGKIWEAGKGRVIYTGNAAGKIQNRELFEAFARKTGMDIEITDKLDESLNGTFIKSTSRILISTNADNMAETLFHEGMGEFMEAYNSSGMKDIQNAIIKYASETDPDFASLAKAYQEAYRGKKDYKKMREAMDEMVNDSLAGIFSTEDGIKDFTSWLDNDNPSEAKTIKGKIADFLDRVAKAMRNLIRTGSLSKASQISAQMTADKASALRKQILASMDTAIGNYEKEIKAFLGDDATIIEAEDGNPILAYNAEATTIALSLDEASDSRKTLNTTQRKLADILKKNGYSEEDIKQAIDTVRNQANMIYTIAGSYQEMEESLDTDIVTSLFVSKDGTREQVIHPFVSNGDYPLNIDFLTICKKRQTYTQVLNDLIDDGIFGDILFNGSAIADVNDILRSKGFETACPLCFVESRRLNIQNWAEKFSSHWNKIVEDKYGKGAPYFGFSKSKRGTYEISKEEAEEIEKEYRSSKKNKQGAVKLGQGDLDSKIENFLEIYPALRKKMTYGDIINPDGIANMKRYGKQAGINLISLAKQSYGTACPKMNQYFSPYNGEVADLTYETASAMTGKDIGGKTAYSNWAVKAVKAYHNGSRDMLDNLPDEFKRAFESYDKSHDWSKNPSSRMNDVKKLALMKYVYDVGGVRLQSFSDFLVENTLDYFQLMADLYAQNLPLHAYTKEISCARIFGMTGGKFNLSLIPLVTKGVAGMNAGLDENGNYSGWGDYKTHMMLHGQTFIQSIGFQDAIALQLDPRYSRNVGTIAVGISDNHILKMLSDPMIRMVIPYHSSGINAVYAEKMGIDTYSDYTDYQNTKVIEASNSALLDKMSSKLSFAKPCTFTFNGKQVTITGDFVFNESVQRNGGDARTAANEYIAWCNAYHDVTFTQTDKDTKEKTVTEGKVKFAPKFSDSKFGTDFSKHENYYKLLEDFNSYDYGDQIPARQQAVQMLYPSGLNAEQEAEYRDRLKKSGQFTDAEIEKYVTIAKKDLQTLIRDEAISRNKIRRNEDSLYDETYSLIKEMLLNPENEHLKTGENADVSAEIEEDLSEQSKKVDDEDLLNDLENGAHYTTYRAFQLIDGGLYSPMAAMDYTYDEKGRKVKELGYQSKLGQWEMATENIDVARTNFDKGKKKQAKDGHWYAQFDLEGGDNQTGSVAYNPYLHSSNVVLNDQFSAAYRRNLVVVECEVPVSEDGGAYFADMAKDPTGWTDWKAGKVAGKISKVKNNFQRQVFLSRYMKPIRILTDSEVAEKYKEYLDGTTVKVPWNVVTKSLREALVKHGIPISYADVNQSSGPLKFSEAFPGEVEQSKKISDSIKASDSEGTTLSDGQREYFANSKVTDKDGNLLAMYHGTRGDFTVFDRERIGSSGAGRFEGNGFNFTPSESRAKGYGGKVMKGYVNIENPLSAEKRTLTASKIAKIIRDIDPTGDEIIANYAEETRDYGKKSFVTRESMTAARSIYDASDNDVDIYSYLSSGGAGTSIMDAFEKMGYDGLIHYNDDGSIRTAITFNSNQFKDYDNLNPTDDNDIRYSVKVSDEVSDKIDDLIDDDLFLDDLFDTVDKSYQSKELAGIFDDLRSEAEAFESASEDIKSGKPGRKKGGKNTVRHLLKSAMGSEFDIVDGKQIAFTDDRIKKYVSGSYYGSSNKDYAQAYVTYMSPKDFLYLTANGKNGSKTLDNIKSTSHELDIEELSETMDAQPIQLYLDEKSAGASKDAIVGHEGRHRMYALAMAGFDKVPVLVFDSKNKYSKQNIESLEVYPQDHHGDSKYNSSNRVTLTDVVVLNSSHMDELIQKFGSGQEADVELSKKIGIETGSDEEFSFEDNSGDVDEYSTDDADLMIALNNDPNNADLQKQYADLVSRQSKGQSSGEAVSYKQQLTQEAAPIVQKGMDALDSQQIDPRAIRKIASDIRKEYGSTYNLNKLTRNLEKLFAYAQQNTDINYEDFLQVVSEVTQPVVDEASDKVNEEYYKRLVSTFKDTKIALTPEQKQAVKYVYGSYAQFQKMMPAGITISENGTKLVDIWQQVTEANPGVFDQNVIEENMPLALEDALNAFRPTAKLASDKAMTNSDAAYDMALEIIRRYFDEYSVAKVKGEVAEQKKKLVKAQEEYRDKFLKKYYDKRRQAQNGEYARVAAIQSKADEKVLEARLKAKETVQKKYEKIKQDDARKQVIKSVGTLYKWAASPSKEHHIPNAMARPIMEFMSSMDFYTPDFEQGADGKWRAKLFTNKFDSSNLPIFNEITADSKYEAERQYEEARSTVLSQNMRKWQDRARDMVSLLGKYKDDPNIYDDPDYAGFDQAINPDLAAQLQEIIENNNDTYRIANLSASDLKVVNNVLKNLIHAVNVKNKSFTQPSESIVSMAQDTIDASRKYQHKERGKFGESVIKFLNFDMATPETFFALNKSEKVYSILLDALYKKTDLLHEAQKYRDEIMQGVNEKDMNKWTGDSAEVKTYHTLDGDIQLTDGQVMGLYELIQREAAQGHMIGGFTVDTIKVKKGKLGSIQHRQSTPRHLDTRTAKAITDTLSDQQRQLADNMQQFMAKQCAEWGNDATRMMYGYDLFTDPHYYPMAVEKKTLNKKAQDTAAGRITNGIANMGMTKNLVSGAKNALVIRDIFDVYSDHVSDMITYRAYAPALADVIRWYNYRETYQMSNKTESDVSVQKSVFDICGSQGNRYFERLIADLNQQEQSQFISTPIEALTGNYKVAAIAGNLRVVVQQPTAIARAAMLIEPKYLFEGLPSVVHLSKTGEQVRENNSLAWYKSQGFYESNIGPSMKQMLTGQQSLKEKIQEKSLMAAGAADDITWGVIYTAAEKQIAAQNAKAGKDTTGEEYRNDVNKLFNDVIAQTQVVDATLFRSQFMRSKDSRNVMQSAFMAEPTKSYNMLLKQYINGMRDASESTGVKDKSKAWAKTMGKAVAVFTATNMLNAAAQSFIDAFRHAASSDDDDKWLDRYADAYLENFSDNENPLKLMPVIKDLIDVMETYTSSDSSSYGSSTGVSMDIQAFTSIAKLYQEYSKAASGNSTKTKYGITTDTIRALSQVSGIPAYNIWRGAFAFCNSVVKDAGYPEKMFTSSEPGTYDNLNRYVKRGDTEKANDEVQSLLDSGKAKNYIRDSLKKNYVSGNDSAYISALEKAGYEAEDAEEYVHEWSDPEQAKEEAAKLKDYTAVFSAIDSGKDIQSSIQSKIDEGVSPTTVYNQIKKQYADKLKDAVNNKTSGYSTLNASLITAVQTTGHAKYKAGERKTDYTRQDAIDQVKKWIEDKD